ncbi:carbohydrate porin [Methylobacterium gnaphalii]|uniref:carbohydrate porin n=1 Tax=Methylobacterium gnaphalii TaxID=1010610 RepID=UPI0035709D5F
MTRCARENAFEAFYAVSLTKVMTVTFDYQHVENPAYNQDRGPSDFFAARLHVDF